MVQVVTANQRICFHIKSCVIVPYNKTMNTRRLLCADIPPRNNSLALYPKSIFDIQLRYDLCMTSTNIAENTKTDGSKLRPKHFDSIILKKGWDPKLLLSVQYYLFELHRARN